MRKFILALAVVPALALSACSNGQTINPAASTLAATALDDKAMYAAEALYNVPADAYVVADNNGKLSPAIKEKAKLLLIKAYAVLEATRAAYKAGNATEFAAQDNNLSKLSEAIKALVL